MSGLRDCFSRESMITGYISAEILYSTDVYTSSAGGYPPLHWYPEEIKQKMREENEKKQTEKFLAEKPWRYVSNAYNWDPK